MSAEDKPPSSPYVWALGLLGLVSLILFFRFEKTAIQPVLPLRFLKDRTALSTGLANFFLSMASFAILYNYPLYFQSVRSQKAGQAGLHLIPNSVALSCGSVLAGIWMRQTGEFRIDSIYRLSNVALTLKDDKSGTLTATRRRFSHPFFFPCLHSEGRYYKYNLFNAFLMVISGIGLTLLSDKVPEWMTYVMIAPSGFGISGVLTCTLIALINSVEREEIATATGMSYMFRYSGQVVGVSLAGVILQGILKNELRKRITGKGSEEVSVQEAIDRIERILEKVFCVFV